MLLGLFENKKVKSIEEEAQRAINGILNFKKIGVDISHIESDLHTTRKKYRRLKRKFRRDLDKRVALAKDWRNYTHALRGIISEKVHQAQAKNIREKKLDVSYNEVTYNQSFQAGVYRKKFEGNKAIKVEIENRFRYLLKKRDKKP